MSSISWRSELFDINLPPTAWTSYDEVKAERRPLFLCELAC